MKKIINLIRKYTWAIFKRMKKHRYKITPRGDCLIRYIIDKYINCTKPDDFIESYEAYIYKREETVRQLPHYIQACIDETGQEDPEIIHVIAAILSVQIILYAINNCEYYYNLITDENARQQIKNLVEMM